MTRAALIKEDISLGLLAFLEVWLNIMVCDMVACMQADVVPEEELRVLGLYPQATRESSVSLGTTSAYVRPQSPLSQ